MPCASKMKSMDEFLFSLILCILLISLIVQMLIDNDDVWPSTGHNIYGAGNGLHRVTRGFECSPHFSPGDNDISSTDFGQHWTPDQFQNAKTAMT